MSDMSDYFGLHVGIPGKSFCPLGKIGLAVVVEALVHHVGIVPAGVRVPAAGMKKGYWVDPCTVLCPNSPKNIQQHWKISMYIEK